MISISRILPQEARLQIFEPSLSTESDMRAWVANQKYFMQTALLPSSFTLRAAGKDYLVSALANDCNRMSIAAIESVSGIKPDQCLGKSGAWGVIRAYYSCFFAAHAIMRIFGISCTQLEPDHVKQIYNYAKTMGLNGGLTKIESGFYEIRIDKNFDYVVFNKYSESHADTWFAFTTLLDELVNFSRNATALSTHKIEVVSLLNSVKDGISSTTHRSKGNWLSHIRNSVNYRHSHGVWFPHKDKQVATNCISKLGREWILKPVIFDERLKRSEIERFFEVATVIVSLLCELLMDCTQKASRVNPIFQNGSIKLLKLQSANS